MRVKQANILEILKVWLKASAVERTAQAGIVAEALANEAKADNKVLQTKSINSKWPICLQSPPLYPLNVIYLNETGIVFSS